MDTSQDLQYSSSKEYLTANPQALKVKEGGHFIGRYRLDSREWESISTQRLFYLPNASDMSILIAYFANENDSHSQNLSLFWKGALAVGTYDFSKNDIDLSGIFEQFDHADEYNFKADSGQLIVEHVGADYISGKLNFTGLPRKGEYKKVTVEITDFKALRPNS
ncbi:hypothetical protein ACIQUS_08930 [Pseudomonas sp. NPDC090755]|uniref:hypothetical protein n=1 Tax=Pseudomonas sp. NPDC090755 TaxID=3364481 RepID=UPI00383B2419